MLIVLLLLLFFNTGLASAEDFEIRLKGQELKKVSALQIKLGFDPKDSLRLEDGLTLHTILESEKATVEEILASVITLREGADILFKIVDSNESVLRIFLARPLQSDELMIYGTLKRSNYTGQASAKISEIKYISDFSKKLDPKKINSALDLIPDQEEALPYMGISKADILGPHERIFMDEMFVSISNIETYGFVCNKSIKAPRINGQEAKFLNDDIIAANLKLDRSKIPNDELEINLELDVDGQVIQKNVGMIKFITE